MEQNDFFDKFPHFGPKQHKNVHSRPIPFHKETQFFAQYPSSYDFQISLWNCVYRPGLLATGKNVTQIRSLLFFTVHGSSSSKEISQVTSTTKIEIMVFCAN